MHLISICRFQNEIKSFETKHELIALAKHMVPQFRPAVCDNERRKCVLLDDLQDCCVQHDSPCK